MADDKIIRFKDETQEVRRKVLLENLEEARGALQEHFDENEIDKKADDYPDAVASLAAALYLGNVLGTATMSIMQKAFPYRL